jgi:hypothetical protein
VMSLCGCWLWLWLCLLGRGRGGTRRLWLYTHWSSFAPIVLKRTLLRSSDSIKFTVLEDIVGSIWAGVDLCCLEKA